MPRCIPCEETCDYGANPSEPTTGDTPTASPSSGFPEVSAGSMSSSGFNLPFNSGLAYDASAPGDSHGFGGGWLPGSLAGLSGTSSGVPATGPVSYKPAPDRTLTFLPETIPGTYKAAWFIKDQLSYDATSSEYSLLGARGSVKIFDAGGVLRYIENPGGDRIGFSYDTLGRISIVSMTVGGVTVSYVYTWTSGMVSDVVYSVAGRAVLKTTYGYAGSSLITVKIWENSTVGTGAPDWGSAPVSASRYSYHSSGLLRHVVPPAQYKQMSNNGINPDTATMAQLDDYAAAEYDYGAYNRVSLLRTHGRRYSYTFSYVASTLGSTSLNSWWYRTNVIQPDGSLHSYYFNNGGQLMLEKVSDSAASPTKTWYPRYQKFDPVVARLVLAADHSAIKIVNEALPELVELETSEGLIETLLYDASGYVGTVRLQHGTSGTPHKQREWTYDSRNLGVLGTIYKPASETVFRNEGGTGGITTSYSYTWHGARGQVQTRTTTFPNVTPAENGRDITYTRIEEYDTGGYLTSSTDERGTVTTYQYDKARGVMTQRIVDAGSGKLNLQTDYTPDDRGRVIRQVGPAHDAIVSGAPVNVRTASWTYYLDREGKQVSFRGYVNTTDNSEHAVGPVSVSEPNIAPPAGYSGWRAASSYDAKWTAGGIPARTTTYLQTDWVRWSLSLTDQKSELKEQWNYFLIPSDGYGAQSTNYGKKLFGYDSAGRQNQTTCAGGTVDKTTYNAMGWATQEELGTSAGLTVTRTNLYDGDGNLTEVSLPVGGGADPRETTYQYDWRNRQIQQTTTVEKDGGGTWTLIQRVTYDNRGLVLSSTGYHTEVADPKRTSYQTTDYDVLGRQYRTKVYGVDAATGATSYPQESNVYYEAGGQVARNAPSGSALFTASTFDAVGRTLKSFQAYEPSGFTSGSDPSSVVSAIVMEQQQYAWDEASNLLSTVSRARFDNASTSETGELGDPGSSSPVPQARVSYSASYADAIGRGIATADYGTNANDAVPWSRTATVPYRSDIILVNSTEYDDAGNATKTIDPAAIETLRSYDNADRLVTLTENANGSTSPPQIDKRVTHYEYTDDGWLKKLKSDNAETLQQVTEWVYGVGPTTSPASALYSNRLVREKLYPEATAPVKYSYNLQLQVTAMTDQAGTAHAYAYDTLGRLLTDTVTAWGYGIDDHVGKLETAYDERGRVSRSTSYGSGSDAAVVRNEVERDYNNFNQLVTEFQEHGGAVDPLTSHKVQYGYESGSANTVRPNGITYPNNTTITTAYTGTQASFLSRPDQVKEGSTVIASMRYLGLGTLVGLNYDAASNTALTYEDGGTGDAGDIYTGLDRFGRLVETLWKKSSAVLVHSKYGRNPSGGVDWRKDVKAHSLSPAVIDQDQFFTYDGLQQVIQRDRGDLTPSGGPPYTGVTSGSRAQMENFSYDETGNWREYGSYDPSFVQTREHNRANQITDLEGPSGVAAVQYDAAGNTVYAPNTAFWYYQMLYKWDAWNRLVEAGGSSSVWERYDYDALTRRVRVTASGITRDTYYDRQWRSIEERVGSTIKVQHTWSPLDRWTLIRRKRSVSGTLDEVRFCLRDYLDPVAIVDSSGDVQERYGYEAFGWRRFMDPDFGTISASTCEWNFLFHGEFEDASTGLYNYGYRYLDPQLGRWLSRDPIEEDGGLNLYAFCTNCGVNNRDILGLMTPCEIVELNKIADGLGLGVSFPFKIKRSKKLYMTKGNGPGTTSLAGTPHVADVGIEIELKCKYDSAGNCAINDNSINAKPVSVTPTYQGKLEGIIGFGIPIVNPGPDGCKDFYFQVIAGAADKLTGLVNGALSGLGNVDGSIGSIISGVVGPAIVGSQAQARELAFWVYGVRICCKCDPYCDYACTPHTKDIQDLAINSDNSLWWGPTE